MKIRQYQASDHTALARLCADGTRTKPFAPLWQDASLAPLLYLDAYLAHEPQACFVAYDGERLVGYVIGVRDAATFDRLRIAHDRRHVTTVLKSYARSVLAMRCQDRRTHRAYLQLIRRCAVGMPEDPLAGSGRKLADFPGRCHLQVAASHHDRGVGLHLFMKFRKYLKESAVPGQHAVATEPVHSTGYSDMLAAMGFECVSTHEFDSSTNPALLDDRTWVTRVLVQKNRNKPARAATRK